MVWICQISQEISQKRTRERLSDQEAKEIKDKAREIMPQPSTVWICQISQEISQKRTRERMSDQEAKEIKAEAREIMPQPSTAWSLYWSWMAAETPRVFRAEGQLIAGKLSFNEAWESVLRTPIVNVLTMLSELHQLDTFYNSLNSNDQDALDSAAGGNFLDKMPQEGLAIIESKSKVRYSRSRANDSRVSTDAPLSNSSSSIILFDIATNSCFSSRINDYQEETKC
ncbi:hypothetical protein Tco_1352720 [Tanacetum coccineum]